MKTLVEKAKEIKRKSKTEELNKDQIELAVAWAKNEISMTSVSKVLDIKNNSNVYTFLALALRQYIQENEL